MSTFYRNAPDQLIWTIDDDSNATKGQYQKEILVRYFNSDHMRRSLHGMDLITENPGFSIKLNLFIIIKKLRWTKGGINIKRLASPELIIQNIGIKRFYLEAIEIHTYQEAYTEKAKNVNSAKLHQLFELIY